MFATKPASRLFTVLFKLMTVLALLLTSALVVKPAHASGTITVTTGADNQTTDGLCSLREAINNANDDIQDSPDCPAGSGNDTIVFANGITSIILGQGLPTITSSDGLTIDGGSQVSINGNHATYGMAVNPFAALTLQNISLTNMLGALSNEGTLNITNSTFSANSSSADGGALANAQGGTATVTGSTFRGNSATSSGGAIANFGTITIANSTFAKNTSNYGGGLINNTGTAMILNSTFSGNGATTAGGAVFTRNGAGAPTTTIRNTILANSSAGGDCSNDVAGTLSGSNNIIESTSSCAGIASISADPKLAALSGSPAYFRLLPASPAIDAGDDLICASPQVNDTSQNGAKRPQGAYCDIGSYELPLTTLSFRSAGAQDGWILESSENSSVGGTLNAIATSFNLGDDAANRQYRAILDFNTSALPDTAVVIKATLKIKGQGLVGTNPFGSHGGLRVDIRKPFFDTSPGLQLTDFQAAADATGVATFGSVPASSWYAAALNASGRSFVNLTGATQFRLRFALDDNNDHIADYMRFYSGNFAMAASRPTLVIEYYLP